MTTRLRLFLSIPLVLSVLWIYHLCTSRSEHVAVQIDGRPHAIRFSNVANEPTPPIVCPEVRVVVFCSPVDPQEHGARENAIRAAWGGGGLYHGSLGSCLHLGITFSAVPQPAIEDTAEWLKAFLSELESHPGLSWLLKVEDTTWLIPERLAELLMKYDANMPLLLGNRLQTGWPPHHEYLSGAGFAVSVAMLKRIRDAGGVQLVPAQLQKVPDVGFALICKSLGGSMPDTRDIAGGERFNVFPPHVAALGTYHDWYVSYKRQAGQPPISGAGCCSSDSVLFQYVGAGEQRSLPLALHTESLSALGDSWHWPRPALFDRWGPQPPDVSGQELALLRKLQSAAH